MDNGIKVMAGFMGYSKVMKDRSGGMSGLRLTGKLEAACFSPVPDYPNDMNALLEVMDSMEGDSRFRNRDIPAILHLAVSSIFNLPELPRVLYPLLLEAIKQIKEGE